MENEQNIALLIDADNCPAGKIDVIMDELAKYGVINIRRAYGNWKSTGLKGWEAALHEYAIQPVQQFDYSKGKNATDIAMAIDAMDLLHTRNLDGFCLASSDCDFTPLVMRLRANGLKVFGFGEKKTPEPFANACSKFLYLEQLGTTATEPVVEITATKDTATATPPVPAVATSAIAKASQNELKGNTRLVSLLRKAVEAAEDDEGWAGLGAVGSHISKQASFDSRNYGYTKLSDLIASSGLFEVRKQDKAIYIRDKKAAKKVA
jgi:uncharacterized protein (TIGR00288 family)